MRGLRALWMQPGRTTSNQDAAAVSMETAGQASANQRATTGVGEVADAAPPPPSLPAVMVNRVWDAPLRRRPGSHSPVTSDRRARNRRIPSCSIGWRVNSRDSGWGLKRLHRLILTSSVYRQRSRIPQASLKKALAIDPDNFLFWRQRLRRLEAEPLRDALLVVSGQINRQFFGYPLAMRRQADGEVITAEGASGKRRSIYLQVLRLTPFTMLELFDQPTMETNCVRRMQSTVSLQALTLLNSQQMATAAEQFAARLRDDAAEPTRAVRKAVLYAYGRYPVKRELELLARFSSSNKRAVMSTRNTNVEAAQQKALADLCQMLLSSNEFSYID